MTTTTKIKTKEDFGWSKGEEQTFFRYNPQLPNGTFLLYKRKNGWYWYYQLGKNVGGNSKSRVKYLCSSFDGKNDEGLTSFQHTCSILQDKFIDGFKSKTQHHTKLSTLIDEYIGELRKEELDPQGLRKYETTQSLINGVNRFRDFCLIKDLRLQDLHNPRRFKEDVKEYLQICKDRNLKRNTIRTYLKQMRYFLGWLSDEDFGKGCIPLNPITLEFINKVYPYEREYNKPRKNVYYKREFYERMFNRCIEKVNDIWNDYLKNGLSKKHNNQPIGIGTDVVYFISLLQLDSGFRLGEVLLSHRDQESWELRKDKKNSSTYWYKVDGEWFLYLDYKGKTSIVPITTTIKSWVKPIGWNGPPTKLNKKGQPLYWETNIIDVCMNIFRSGPYLFSSPNYRSHYDRPYSKTYYMNIFKSLMVNNGVGGEGWEGYGVQSSHDLRDYFITHKINEGFDPFDLCKITRHSITTMLKYYERDSETEQLKRQKKLDKTRVVHPRKEFS